MLLCALLFLNRKRFALLIRPGSSLSCAFCGRVSHATLVLLSFFVLCSRNVQLDGAEPGVRDPGHARKRQDPLEGRAL